MRLLLCFRCLFHHFGLANEQVDFRIEDYIHGFGDVVLGTPVVEGSEHNIDSHFLVVAELLQWIELVQFGAPELEVVIGEEVQLGSDVESVSEVHQILRVQSIGFDFADAGMNKVELLVVVLVVSLRLHSAYNNHYYCYYIINIGLIFYN